MKWRYVGIYILFFIVWNYYAPSLLGGGMGHASNTLNKYEKEKLDEARAHPNQIVGALDELVSVPLLSFTGNLFIMIIFLFPPLMGTGIVYSIFNQSSNQKET